MNTTKCRIPIGTFYGHSYVLPCDGYAEDNAYSRPNTEINVQVATVFLNFTRFSYPVLDRSVSAPSLFRHLFYFCVST